jgi:hypothetical protein
LLAQAQSVVNFGPTNLNLTLQRLDNCTQGGPLDICSICKARPPPALPFPSTTSL